MDVWVYVVAGIVVAAILYFALIRKRPALPEQKAAPPSQITSPEAAERASQKTKQLAPAQRSPTPPSVKAAEPVGAEPPPPAAPEKPATRALSKKDVDGIRKGLAATRGGFIARLTALFTGKKEIDPAILEQIEEVMISSDVGVKTTQAILERLRERLAKNELADVDAVWAALRAEATRILSIGGGALKDSGGDKPTV